MPKFEVGDKVSANGPRGPIVEVTENLGTCYYPHDCQGEFGGWYVDGNGERVDFRDHVDDFEKVSA